MLKAERASPRRCRRSSPDRLRNLRPARGAAARRGDARRGGDGRALLTRIGEDGGANYLAAVLLTRCATAPEVGEHDRERWAARAVTCLGAALAARTVGTDALRSDSFVALRGRDDFAALRQR
ncbi:MAG: hypothetical protein R3F29_11625 [Planctomycetota bacterium]